MLIEKTPSPIRIFLKRSVLSQKWVVELVDQKPAIKPSSEIEIFDLRDLNAAQKEYFYKAWAAFQANMCCWSFDGPFFFNSSSRLWNVIPDDKKAIEHPLYKAIKTLWLALGVNQEQMGGKDKVVYVVI